MISDKIAKLVQEHGARIVDLRWADLAGRWQHVSLPATALSGKKTKWPFAVERAEWGHESVRLHPDPATAQLDPFREYPTLAFICNAEQDIHEPRNIFDVRGLAQRTEEFFKSRKMALDFAITAEFFIFDDVRHQSHVNQQSYIVDSIEGDWNSGREEHPNLGGKRIRSANPIPVPPVDHYQDLRSEIVLTAAECGARVLSHRPGNGPGKALVELAPAALCEAADQLLMLKYVARNTALKYGKTITFMPHPLLGLNQGEFAVRIDLSGASLAASDFVAGLQKHAAALRALTTPSTNSFRLRGLRKANDPMRRNGQSISCYRVDGTANPYLALSALALAGLAGEAKKSGANESRPPAVHAPHSLEAAINALAADHAFLLAGKVFTKPLLDELMAHLLCECELVQSFPHPHEFSLYYDL